MAVFTYDWALEMLASDKHSSLMGPFASYKENELFRIRP
jgi:hypothetical protein